MDPWLVVSAVVAIALVFVLAPIAVTVARDWRRPWRLTCPHTGRLAQIRVLPGRAALAALAGREPAIERCSLWPPPAQCRDDCLALPRTARQVMRRGEAPPRARADSGLNVILVALDGSPEGEQAVPAVAALAGGCGASLRLLRVVPRVTEVRTGGDRVVAYADQETARIEREAHDWLRALAARLAGVPASTAVRFGDVNTAIVDEAEAAGADLIVLAMRRRGRLGRRLATVRARRLGQATTIPLLLVPATGAAAS